MSAIAKKANKVKSKRDVSTATSRGYGGHNPYWLSSLFNEVYLRNDVPKKYSNMWDIDEGFELFHQQFHNFVIEMSDENFDSWSESDTIKNWIVHIMDMLGWNDKCESKRTSSYITELSLTIPENGRKRTYRADLVYVDEPSHKQYITKESKAEERIREARSDHTGALMVLEAKYWDCLEHNRQNRKEDKNRLDINPDEGTRHLDANDQILKYMDILHRDFGILTDGKTWRLFHRELSRGDIRRYFEFDLGNLAALIREGIDDERSRDRFMQEARYFYFFFRKSSLVQVGTKVPFVYEVLEYSKKYASSIEKDLKERFIQSMGFMCNALNKSVRKSKKTISSDMIRNVSESHLFNILFIRSCESRKILPINPPAYHRISLTEVIETLDHISFDPEKDLDLFISRLKDAFGPSFTYESTEIYDRLMLLYKIVQNGDMGFGIPGFKESVFTAEELAIANSYKIPNSSMIKILFSLNFTDSEFGGRKYQQIPYNFFTPRQLGSIYESFLEFKLEEADKYKLFTAKQWKNASKGSDAAKALLKKGAPEVLPGDLYFTPDNKDRKMTGSFYTPDLLVEHVIRDTLGPLCKDRSSEEILKITVCDPAMGSGHFLSGSLKFLTEKYREALANETISDVNKVDPIV